MLVSILHRVTGIALSIAGLAVLTWWLMATRAGAGSLCHLHQAGVEPDRPSIVLVGLTWAFFQHLLSGIRHLVMDTGGGVRARHQQDFRDPDHRRLAASDRSGLVLHSGSAGMSLGESATPLGKVRGLGSAREGGEHWLSERVTSIALLLLGTWLIASLLFLPDLRPADRHRMAPRAERGSADGAADRRRLPPCARRHEGRRRRLCP